MAVLWDYWRSSAAYRVRIGLNLLGIAYEGVPVDLLKKEQAAPEHLARNPQGLVPVLDIDGLRLTQSLAILEYLEETRSAGWLPADPPGRARVRALACAVAMDIHPVCNLRVVRYAIKASKGAIEREAWMRAFISDGLAALERMLDDPATGRFAHGDGVSLADICLVPQVFNARRWGVDLEPLPRIRAIDAACLALPAFAAASPERQPGAE
jgi:maleylacetoacetate isomerase